MNNGRGGIYFQRFIFGLIFIAAARRDNRTYLHNNIRRGTRIFTLLAGGAQKFQVAVGKVEQRINLAIYARLADNDFWLCDIFDGKFLHGERVFERDLIKNKRRGAEAASFFIVGSLIEPLFEVIADCFYNLRLLNCFGDTEEFQAAVEDIFAQQLADFVGNHAGDNEQDYRNFDSQNGKRDTAEQRK